MRLCRTLALISSAVPGLVSAQRLRGTVTVNDTAAAGIVLIATDPAGDVAARALSGSAGTFDIRLHAAGTYTLSALRIGHRPTVVDGIAVADTGATIVRVALNAATVTLAAVDVRSKDVCRGARGADQDAVVQAWSEARTALTAASLWSRVALEAEWVTYSRSLKPGTEAVRQQEVRVVRANTTHAFRSWAADSLAVRGYAITDDGGTTYYAPDPDVLLSDSFAEAHCFHLAPAPADRPGLVGIGFRPARSRGARVDIEGTVWVDAASAELRAMEFQYTGLPAPAADAKAGGRVDFVRLAEGPWMVSRWQIRMPQVGPPEHQEKGYQRTFLKDNAVALRGIGLRGGAVARVRRGGQTLYVGAGASLELQVTAEDGRTDVALPQVTLAGTDYSWRGDSAGRVRASPVLEGRYTARIATAEMQALGVAPVEREVVVSTARHVDTVAVPSGRDVVQESCGKATVKAGRGVLYGIVRDGAGRPAAARSVTSSFDATLTTRRGAGVVTARTTLSAVADDAGRFRLCDVPRGMPLTVRASGADGTASEDVEVDPEQWSAGVSLRLRSEASASGLAATHPVLDPVRVVGDRRKSSTGYDGFELRRLRKEATVSYTAEEIRAKNPADLASLIGTVGGIRMADSAGVVLAQLLRGFSVDPNGKAQACNMRLLLDGMAMPEMTNINLVRPQEIKGLEVYASTSRIPSALAAMPGEGTCGIIAVWTVRVP